MQQITSSSDKFTKKNIQNRQLAQMIPGGCSMDLSTLAAGVVVPEGTPLTAPASGKRKVCKQAVILTGSTTTVFVIDTDSNPFAVGEFLGVQTGGLAYEITDITDNGDGTTDVTVDTALENATVGGFLYEMSAEATGVDATLNIAYANDTSTGLTDDATSAAETLGTAQATLATIVGPIGASGAGNVAVTVSSDLFDDEVLSVAVANDDTSVIVASKIKQALLANETIATYFEVSGFEDEVVLALKTAANVSALENTPDCILAYAFEAPSATQVIFPQDGILIGTVIEGAIGSEYLSLLKGIVESKY